MLRYVKAFVLFSTKFFDLTMGVLWHADVSQAPAAPGFFGTLLTIRIILTGSLVSFPSLAP